MIRVTIVNESGEEIYMEEIDTYASSRSEGVELMHMEFKDGRYTISFERVGSSPQNPGNKGWTEVGTLSISQKFIETVDRSALEASLRNCDGLVENEYQADSWAEFEAVLEEANTVHNKADEETCTAEMEDISEQLDQARLNLRIKADLTELKKALEQAKAIKEGDYSKESYESLHQTVLEVESFLNSNYNQDEVDAKTTLLLQKIGELTVDKSGLEENIREAESLKEENYTEATWEELKTALTKAQGVNDDEEAVQSEVDEAAEALSDAIDALEEVEVLPAELPFKDVKDGDWFYNYVYDVYVKGLMTGLEKTIFGPGNDLVRAQFAVIIYRMEDEPKVTFKDTFADVKSGQFYGNAVIWAAENGIVTGYTSTGLFGPNDKITREQMAAIMFRYAKYKQLDTTEREKLDDFTDGDKVQPFAVDAMEWCVANKIISGKGEDNAKYLDPQTGASRAECATIISRYTEME